MNKRWLIPLTLVVILAVATAGAFAYFTSTKTATGNITAGNLELKLFATTGYDSPCGVPDSDSVTLWDMTKMYPGQEVEGKLCMRNVGSVDAKQVTMDWGNLQGKLLAKSIFVTSFKHSTRLDGFGNPFEELPEYIAQYDGIDGTVKDGNLSLSELDTASVAFPQYGFDEYYDNNFLPAGSTQWVYYKFQFDPNAGNALQNESLPQITLNITAHQNVVFPVQ